MMKKRERAAKSYAERKEKSDDNDKNRQKFMIDGEKGETVD